MSKPARRLSVAVTAGAAMSAVALSTLISGTSAYAAAPSALHAPLQPSSTSTYTVVAGDTMSGIALRHGVSLAAVFAANNMNMGTIIYPDQSIHPRTSSPYA
ncbi:LysM peptidoglycan-binding domain-containing protein [Arthrobacter sp. SAFR-044]|uniref:LysM peptidoglycan-binding domain-containing protein n=1 Tax=Arthrobacter sp. SAFR-044 TaxID=3387278 RepID=UPI003F7CBE02